LPSRMRVIDPTLWHQLAQQKFGGGGTTGRFHLTRGGAAICWAITTHPGATVVLVGFDNVMSQQFLPLADAFAPVYLEEYCAQMGHLWKHKLDYYDHKQTKSASHDIVVELLVIQHLAQEHRVALLTAQEAWG